MEPEVFLAAILIFVGIPAITVIKLGETQERLDSTERLLTKAREKLP